MTNQKPKWLPEWFWRIYWNHENPVLRIVLRIMIPIYIILMIGVFSSPIIQINTPTQDGSHVGIITTVERNGLIWSTPDIYFKSSAESTQEKIYCIDNTNLIANQLVERAKRHAINRDEIELRFHTPLITWRWQCKYAGNGIIDEMRLIK